MPLISTVPPRTLTAITGAEVTVPDPGRLVHLQFRRFAGCPVCHLHLRSIVARRDEIDAAGIREVVVFHSTADALRKHEADLPVAVIADPDRRLYREFGVETAARAVLDPRAWPGVVRAVTHAAVAAARLRRPVPPLRPEGGSLGLPADFLIASDGRVVAAKHGAHADDQWSVDELLSLAPVGHPAR
ncbi:peroxiredoxin-like family protein [Nocardia higoensis]|uniref:peroxiredoxin-like family protein n=1 Tax=Nocardia higoensis TaxID=228599 RepID=UPI00031A7793|nr:peroxiredoxin-like family protein [Nocardia higoensis]